MNITNYSPVIVRYAIVSLMAAMFTRGWLSPEHNAILRENFDIIIAFGISLGILYIVTKGGFSSGQRASPTSDASTAQVAAVIVDSSALNRGTAALEALNVTLMDTNAIGREHVRSNSALAEELDRVREELRIQREVRRR